MQNPEHPNEFLHGKAPKALIVFNALLAAIYFYILVFIFPVGNKVLFGLLVFGEVFHVWQLFTFLYTIWDRRPSVPLNAEYYPAVDVYITVAGESTALIEETVQGAMAMDYPDFKVFLLNDGYVAKKDNWGEVEVLAKQYGATAITRKIPGGAKAGNINNAVRQTISPFIAIFDADHIPHADFLKKTVPFFSDEKVAFIQSPQYYKNFTENEVTGGAWEQQQLFFGPICEGKNRLNAVTMCGTNMVIRRAALLEVGGMCEESIAEDFATGMFMHRNGWKSVYVPEVLAEGLAPEDFLSYYKQQLRWARGGLDVLFKYNLLFTRGLTFRQRLQYLSSVSFFFSGVVVLINAAIPLVFFYTGLVPFLISTMLLATIFLPYIFFTLYTLQTSTNFCFTYRSLAFSVASFSIHIRAWFSALFGGKATFEVTSKKKIQGNFLHLVRPHIAYIAAAIVGVGYAVWRDGVTASLVANASWALLNSILFSEFIFIAMPESEVKREVDRSRKAVRTIITKPRRKVLQVNNI